MNNKFEQNNIDESKKNKMVAITFSILSIFVLIGIGMAYFSAPLSNTNKEKYSTETATIALKFDDNDNGISGNLNLGESIIKKFTLQNTGTKDAYAKINWYNLVNTYTSDSLTWTLEQSTSENGTYEALGSGKVPTSSTQTTKQLKNGILVPVNTTYYYKLTITLNNLDINQNSDINASFYSYFNLEEGKLTGVDTIQNLVAGEPTNTTNVITGEVPSGANCTNTLAYDGTTDNNLRYVGSNPCNYVTFNGETAGWRIVGIMNNIDDGTGNLETRIKLIRATSLGNYSWDSSDSSVNRGYGVNDWTQADLKNELNGDYLNTSLNANTNWYNGSNNTQSATFDYTKRLNAAAQNLIGDAKWYLGGFINDYANLITSVMYINERGTTVVIPGVTCSGIFCNDGITRATEWTGKVALIYPSDYGFATSGGMTTVRSTCVEELSIYGDPGETWYDNNNSDCKNNDWLKPSFDVAFFLSPVSSGATYVFGISGEGYHIFNETISNVHLVFPAVYLGSSVSISGGSGTIENPYTLS